MISLHTSLRNLPNKGTRRREYVFLIGQQIAHMQILSKIYGG